MRDLIIPIGVVAVLASMLLPVPPTMLDFLLIANFIVALLLLISTLYISEPLKLSALPTILLLATLYRLAINVATTRLILSHGEAGEVVEAFGSVVAQGNLVVGAVVFMVITLVQFLVIAKGSERVAEVAARFTLDALPGKQMSIDADVRAGLLDMAAARDKRQELQTESRFYGALDGAMKFVKGDAIAGIIIVLINIVGGLLSGVLMHQLSLSDALAQYTILTIGDGLVSQVPSLLNSLAAGMVVTRVVRGDGAPLALELLNQIGQQRKVHYLIGAVSISLALFSALPALPLLGLGAFCVFSATRAPKAEELGKVAVSQQPFKPRTPALLNVSLTPALAKLIYASAQLTQRVDKFKKEIFEASGLILPSPEFSVDSAQTAEVVIKIRGIFAESFKMPTDLAAFEATFWPGFSKLLHARAVEFVDDQLTRRTLDSFDAQAPELVSAVVPSLVSVTQLTEILRALVRDHISIVNFDLILQAVAEAAPRAPREGFMLEEVRIALKRVICANLSIKQGRLAAFSLDGLAELTLAKCEREKTAPDTELLEQIFNDLSRVKEHKTVLLCTRTTRRLLAEACRIKALQVNLIAWEELIEEIQVDNLGVIGALSADQGEALIERLAA